MTDLVQWTLDTLDANWSQTTYATKPTLVDRRDTDRVNKKGRSMIADTAENNAVGVGPGPDDQHTPAGTYDNNRVDAAVAVRIEATHEDQWGHIADAAEWKSLKDAVQYALNLERSYPVGDYHTLVVATESDQSQRWKNHYRADLTVEFRGYEPLP